MYQRFLAQRSAKICHCLRVKPEFVKFSEAEHTLFPFLPSGIRTKVMEAA